VREWAVEAHESRAPALRRNDFILAFPDEEESPASTQRRRYDISTVPPCSTG